MTLATGLCKISWSFYPTWKLFVVFTPHWNVAFLITACGASPQKTNWSEKFIFSLPQAARKTWHQLWFIDPPTHTIWTLYKNIPKMVHNRCARCNLFNFQVLTMLTTFKMLPMLSYWMCCDWSRPRFDILSIYASASKTWRKWMVRIYFCTNWRAAFLQLHFITSAIFLPALCACKNTYNRMHPPVDSQSSPNFIKFKYIWPFFCAHF